jgi:hypothetical protein
MKSPQPPDPWQSQPSTPEDEVYEPDPDDADTGPLQVPTPRPDGAGITCGELFRHASNGEPAVGAAGPQTTGCPRHRRVGDRGRRRPGLLVVASVAQYTPTRPAPTRPRQPHRRRLRRTPSLPTPSPVAGCRACFLRATPPKLANRPHRREAHWQSSAARRTPTRAARCRRRTRWCETKPRWVGLSTPALAPPTS